MDNSYECRICHKFHDKNLVIDLFSKEAEEEQIGAKMYAAYLILINKDDCADYICKICYKEVESYCKRITEIRKDHAKLIHNKKNSALKDRIKTRYNKIKRASIVDALFDKHQFDAKATFDELTEFVENNNENLSWTRNFDNHNSIINQFDIENDTPVGIPENSSVLELNMPCTNEANVDTNDIDNIHNSGMDLNNRSLRPIINTNSLNHATNVSIPGNILLNAHIPAMSSNNFNHTINHSSRIIRFIPNNIRTNNVNNAINNINQSRINRPTICKNNVIKSNRFRILSINRRRVETNTVQNFGSATLLNQSNVNSSSIVQSTLNVYSGSVQSNVNGQINEISDDEVICLDDDDDDDDNNNNGNGNNLQRFENSIIPLNQLIQPPRITNNNNAKTHISKSYLHKNKKKAKKMIKFKRFKKVIYMNKNNAPSTNISTEEMTVTPDMPLSTSDAGSLLNQGENMYFDDVDNEPTKSLLVEPETEPLPAEPETEPSRVLPYTGFHFLFSTGETVDLTTKEDDTPKKKPIIRQKKTPKSKKAVASRKQTQKTSTAQNNLKTKNQLIRLSTSSTIEKKQTRTSIAQHNLNAESQLLRSLKSPTTEQSDTSLTKPRPKRASAAIDSFAEIKNSGLYKLGKHREGRWAIHCKSVSFSLYQCPICDVYLYDEDIRKAHEVSKHSSLLEFIDKPVDNVSTPGNTACSQQLYLFNYLRLCVTSKNKTKAVHQLAKKTNLLKAFKIMGRKTIDSFKCNYCLYETNLVFALWAHETSTHLYIKCDSEKKSCSFCFLCNRILTKRTTMLKHLDACINKHNESPTTNNSLNRFKCDHCGDSFDSLSELGDHFWAHGNEY